MRKIMRIMQATASWTQLQPQDVAVANGVWPGSCGFLRSFNFFAEMVGFLVTPAAPINHQPTDN